MADIALSGALTYAGNNASKYLLEPMLITQYIQMLSISNSSLWLRV